MSDIIIPIDRFMFKMEMVFINARRRDEVDPEWLFETMWVYCDVGKKVGISQLRTAEHGNSKRRRQISMGCSFFKEALKPSSRIKMAKKAKLLNKRILDKDLKGMVVEV